MKVCIIASIFHPHTRGGAEVVAATCARAFREAGHSVSILTIQPWGGLRSLASKHESWEGIIIHRFFPLNLFSFLFIDRHSILSRLIWHAIDMFNVHTYYIVKKWLKREKPDLILTHNLKGIGYTAPAAIRAFQKLHATRPQRSRLRGGRVRYSLPATPWFHTLHDMGALHPTGLKIWGQEEFSARKNFFVNLYMRINRRLFGSPDIVLSPSRYLLDEYARAGFFPRSRREVIPNPADAKPVDAMRPPVPSFLYVGQLEPYKGIAVLLEAWRIFRAHHTAAELVIAGDGSAREVAEDAARKDGTVRFLGRVAHDKISSLAAGAHFSVLPSLAYENAPTFISESMMQGTPVIAGRLGGIPEMVEDGENGFLFEPGNADDLARAMERALASDRQALHERARSFAERFRPADYVKRVERLAATWSDSEHIAV